MRKKGAECAKERAAEARVGCAGIADAARRRCAGQAAAGLAGKGANSTARSVKNAGVNSLANLHETSHFTVTT